MYYYNTIFLQNLTDIRIYFLMKEGNFWDTKNGRMHGTAELFLPGADTRLRRGCPLLLLEACGSLRFRELQTFEGQKVQL